MKKALIVLSLISNLVITPVHAAKPNECIENLPNYVRDTELDLSGCNLKGTDMPAIVNFLDQHKKITDLHLDNNKIGPRGGEQIAKITTIKMLDISNNKLGNQGVTALAKNTSIETLFIFNNKINDDGITALAKNRIIKSLLLGNDNFGSKGIVELARNTTLDYLFLSSKKIDGKALEAFSYNKTLTGLHLPNANLNSNAAAYFAKMPALTFLVIYGSHIGDEGVKFLSKSTSLTGVGLDGSGITDEGVKTLAAMTNIRHLDLDNLTLAHHIGIIISANKSIEDLVLINDKLHDEDAFALASMNLQFLNVQYNSIGRDGIEALKNSKTIKQLIVEDQDNDNKKTSKKLSYIAAFQNDCVHHSSAFCHQLPLEKFASK